MVLAKVVSFFNEDHPLTPIEGYLYSGLLIGMIFISFLISFQGSLGLTALGMRARIASCSVMYRKVNPKYEPE